MRYITWIFLVSMIIFLSGCSGTNIEQNPLIFKTESLPIWIENSFGSFQIEAEGGTPPYNYGLADNNVLPQGFTLTTQGVISGMGGLNPGTSKSISVPFVVIVTDAGNRVKERTFTITIIESLRIILNNLVGTVNQNTDINVARARGGSPPYTFQQDTLREGIMPLGMTLDMNGNLKGMPKKPGTYSFGVCVKDLNGLSDCGIVNVTFEPAKIYKLSILWKDPVVSVAHWNTGINHTCDDKGCYVLQYENENISVSETTQEEGATFKGFEGDCSGMECNLIMDSDKTVYLTYNYIQKKVEKTPTLEIIEAYCRIISQDPYYQITYEIFITGKATGSVGSRVVTIGSDARIECKGTWSQKSTYCTRQEGEPETGTFTYSVQRTGYSVSGYKLDITVNLWDPNGPYDHKSVDKVLDITCN